ncbi:helix-turn-helix domain-containing protein [Flavobacterium rakeshii]|uniref:Helix-turn-helix domain-containing protein n=1 Tax=Flavobacterium rakeshii TaxID=1038845 RepID=A0A6N8HG27_9FLAO|nr:AraC family transcriptional regulator [Flavobacterium rakeshii]MUV04697.1 helix-turn-helix domain-containing protein [Flavobacterium rakeshii]
MRVHNIQSCHLGPEISPEQFISEHFFLYLLKGSMNAYDGNKQYQMVPGDYCIARKNHLVRYTKYKDNGAFEKIIITFDAAFLQQFLERHPFEKLLPIPRSTDSFVFLPKQQLVESYIQSLAPYYNGQETLNATFADIKREELLLILLQNAPELQAILFNFGIPEKLNLEAFMLKNFRFNVSLERFAFLTGRSLSAFKRDFKKVFGVPPGAWLKKKRLEEAYFLLSKENRKPSEVYLEVGFEDLSHFSFVFKKEFGKTPGEVQIA